MTRIQWAQDPELVDFFDGQRMAWVCNCGQPLTVVWRASCALYDGPIAVDGAISNHWQLECYAGHVLLMADELQPENEETFDPPTVEQIVTFDGMAYVEDVFAWQVYVQRESKQPKAGDLRALQTFRRGDVWWRVEIVEPVDPGPVAAPYVRLKCRDEHDEVQTITLPADMPVEVRG